MSSEAPAHSKLADSSKLMTATLHKEYGTDGGITLRTFAGKLMISYVTPETSKATGLKRGFEVLTMNNVDCTILSESSAQKLLEGDEMVTFLVKEMESALVPGTLVTTVLYKESQDSPVGMGVKVVDGQVCVGNIKEGSAAAATDLRTGMILKYINNFDCVGLNSNQAAMLLANASGKVEILTQVPGKAKASKSATDVSTITVTLTQDFDGTDLGLELISAASVKTGKNLVIVKSISEDSPFFGTALRVGMQITSVQNIDCTEGAKHNEVAQLLMDNVQPGATLMVLGRDCSDERRAPGSFLTVVINKESADQKLGVVMASKSGKVFIKKISDGTLGSRSELETGMWLHSINNNCLVGQDSAQAAQILKNCEGRITFLCQTPGGNSYLDPAQMVTATMIKEGDDKVGLGLKDMIITKCADGSLVADTDLEVGMRVLQINNIDMAGKTSKDAAKMFSEAEGLLTIVASKPDRAAGSLVVASIEIPQVAEGEDKPSIGLKMKAKDGEYYISGITAGSLASSTELREGMIIKSVNNVDCASKKDLKDVLTMFKQTSGFVNILAAVPGGKPPSASALVTACCVTGKNVPAGSIAYDEATGEIKVTDTGASGILFGTALRAGMEILSINNVDASLFSKVGFENLLASQERLIFLAKRQELKPDLLITEVLHKETADAALGIGLRKINGSLYISSIKDGTLASTSKLMPGMQLISIDNEEVDGASVLVVAKALKEAVGDVTIVASTKEGGLSKLGDVSLVTAVIEKGEKDARVGLTFVRKRGLLVITKIGEGTPAAETDLLVGMDVLSINNTDVSEMSSKEATLLLAEAEGNITILAKRPSLPPGSFVTAAIVKEEGGSVGLKLVGLRGGGVMIKSVTPLSPASFTELEEGMVIKSINNTNTTQMDTKEVAKLLKADVKALTILAQTTKEVAMGRASFRSMRSLTSARSLGESISSGMSAGQEEREPKNMEGTEITTKKDVETRSSAAPVAPVMDEPVKTIEPEEPVMDVKSDEETITVVTGGKRASFVVKNVVDC